MRDDAPVGRDGTRAGREAVATRERTDPVPDGSRGIAPGTMSALLLELATVAAGAGDRWADALGPGAVVGPYTLLREIGRGGFGTVWAARGPDGAEVALKALRDAGGRGAREDLLREADVAARLSHPNVVALLDAGRVPEGAWIVHELLHGETLEDALARGALPAAAAVRVAIGIAGAIAHAHAHGVVHRDLKPANVFLCEGGAVKVLDFGLAHAAGRRKVGGGSSGYMAPEQARGAPEDERTDVYALGVVLFRMLAGALPFRAGRGTLPGARAPALAVDGAPSLGPLVVRMLERDPVRRPKHGGEVLRSLEQAALALASLPADAPVRVRVRRRRPRWVAPGAAATALAAAILAGSLAARAPPPPLDAYEAYFRGLRAFEVGEYEDARAGFERALAIDPDLALAHVWLAFLAGHGQAEVDGAAHLEAAARSAERLPDKERRLVRAYLAQRAGRREEAAAGFRALAADFPRDAVVLGLAGEALTVAPGDEGWTLLREALARDPAAEWPLYYLLVWGGPAGRSGELLPLAERAVRHRPSPGTLANLCLARGHAGDPAGALDAARRALAAAGEGSPTRVEAAQCAAAALAVRDRIDDALAELAPWRAPGAPRRAWALHMTGIAEARGGRRAAARRTIAEALALQDAAQVRALELGARWVGGDEAESRAALRGWNDAPPGAAWLFAWHGLAERGAALAARLPPDGEPRTLYAAAVARREGRREDAVRLVRAGTASQRLSHLGWARGVALAEAGRCEEAIAELDRVPEAFPWMWPQGIWLAARAPLALLESARCCARLGRPAEARARLDRLLALWARADPDLPALADARALRARLASR